MTSQKRTYYWLVPSAEDKSRFNPIIEKLADVQNAPVFEPHLSLAAIEGVQPDLQPCLDLVRDLSLMPLEIGVTDTFTMSLFVRVERSQRLLNARRYMEQQPGFKASRSFDPHLSLCYGARPPHAENMPEVQNLLASPIRFDTLCTVAIPAKVETYDDVRSWRVLERHPL